MGPNEWVTYRPVSELGDLRREVFEVVERHGNPSVRDIIRLLKCSGTDLYIVLGMLLASGHIVVYEELGPGESRLDMRAYPHRPMTDICCICRQQKDIDVLYRVGSKVVCLDCQGRAMEYVKDRIIEEG